ncbi:DUF4192 domain-containing protein [Micromonospora coxensis]|uniref:DUF4192 domain-containing protein n=1 Tax=Micromonospora coxensis TaxID=356852 RepID=UPI003435D330
MENQEPARMRLASISDVLAVVPYLLGFHPADSLVIVGLTGARVTVAGRSDLPHDSDLDQWVAASVSQHLALLRNVDADAAFLIGYGPAPAVTPVVDRVAPRLRDAAVTIVDTVRVTDGRYHSYHCQDPHCCPADGVPFDAHYSPTAVHAVVAGQTALPDRAALVASLAPTGGTAMAAATRRAHHRRITTAAAGRAALLDAGRTCVGEVFARYAAGAVAGDEEVAWLTVLLTHTSVRDIAWRATDDEPWHIALWADVTRRADPTVAAAPATLLAFTAWRQGQGALAAVALDRALTADPDYRLALIIDSALRHAVPPTALDGWPTAHDPTP